MDKYIYCLEEYKDKFLAEGLKFICTQNLGGQKYYVFENKGLKNLVFDKEKVIQTNKMFF